MLCYYVLLDDGFPGNYLLRTRILPGMDHQYFCYRLFTLFQNVKRTSATVSGLELLPVIGGFLIFSIITGAVVAKTGHFKTFPPLGYVLSFILVCILTPIVVVLSLPSDSVWLTDSAPTFLKEKPLPTC